MSRAFVKESDDDSAAGEMPERPLHDHPNYVTPRGLALLQVRLRELRALRDRLVAEDDAMAIQKLLEVRRDIRYYKAQAERAQVVDSRNHPGDEVHFGATVTIIDAGGKTRTFHIVGDDEADIACGRISWASPLARALIGARVGDSVQWQRPAGASALQITAISYDSSNARCT